LWEVGGINGLIAEFRRRERPLRRPFCRGAIEEVKRWRHDLVKRDGRLRTVLIVTASEDSMQRYQCSLQSIYVLLLASLSLPQFAAAAQEPVTTATIRGRVSEEGDSAITVGGAAIELTGTGYRVYADRTGRFTLGNIAPGDYELRIRRLGYRPFARRLSLAEGAAVDETFELPRLAGALTAVVIEGRMVRVPARFEDVYRRGSSGWGKFITREMIDSLQPFDTKRLFDGIPSVRVSERGIQFDRCMNQAGNPYKSNVQVYVDGDRRTRLQRVVRYPNPLDMIPTYEILDDANDVLKSIKPSEIQAMEIYTGTARIPGEFNNDSCAVIAIWTKSY
jgi:hypothetical protein